MQLERHQSRGLAGGFAASGGGGGLAVNGGRPGFGGGAAPVAKTSAAGASADDGGGAGLGGWLPDGSLLISTRFGETSQVHRVKTPLGARSQLTFFPEPVAAVAGEQAA